MADVHSREIRSFNMSQIKGKNTKPELVVRKFLFANGFRYRLHNKKLPGKPDIVLPRYRTIIFIHGCFWHGHTDCKYFKIPATRTEWWEDKIRLNKINDNNAINALQNAGWNTVVIWECKLKPNQSSQTLTNLLIYLKQI